MRKNLYAALKLLRRRWNPEVSWWIDAICINQKDIPERNQAVPLMKEIYMRSTGVVVWFGPSDQDCDSAFSMIKIASQFWEVPEPKTMRQFVIDEGEELER